MPSHESQLVLMAALSLVVAMYGYLRFYRCTHAHLDRTAEFDQCVDCYRKWHR